jgi:hypothetical protein
VLVVRGETSAIVTGMGSGDARSFIGSPRSRSVLDGAPEWLGHPRPVMRHQHDRVTVPEPMLGLEDRHLAWNRPVKRMSSPANVQVPSSTRACIRVVAPVLSKACMGYESFSRL